MSSDHAKSPASSDAPAFATYSKDWFSHNIATWSALLADLAGKPNLRALEIGVFEGRSTCWLMENILTSQDARIDCIDSFHGGMEHGEIDMHAVYTRFLCNTAKWKEKLTLHVGNSVDILPTLTGKYNVIYIDGSHTAHDVLIDIVLSWRLAQDNAIIIFDDYEWDKFKHQPLLQPKIAIHAALSAFTGWYRILHKGYQLAIRKLPEFDSNATKPNHGNAQGAVALHPSMSYSARTIHKYF